MKESKITKAALRGVAKAVLGSLPSCSNPMELPLSEAIELGKKIYPYWILAAVRNPGHIVHVEAICEMLGRGFLFAAPRAIPRWMESVWALKEEITDSDELLDAVCNIIVRVDDPEKQAANWHLFACGWTEEEVILEYASRLHASASTTEHEQVLAGLEDL